MIELLMKNYLSNLNLLFNLLKYILIYISNNMNSIYKINNFISNSFYDLDNNIVIVYNNNNTLLFKIQFLQHNKIIPIGNSVTIETYILHGTYEEFFPNGNCKRRIQFNLNKRNGNDIQYYDNGKIHKFCSFISDEPFGTLSTYYPNGIQEYCASIKNGLYHGIITKSDMNGRLVLQYNMNEGKKHGFCQYNTFNPDIIDISYWENGKQIKTKLFDKIKYYLFSNEPINNPVLPNLYHI